MSLGGFSIWRFLGVPLSSPEFREQSAFHSRRADDAADWGHSVSNCLASSYGATKDDTDGNKSRHLKTTPSG
jgi:hypothetical protein